ncbi:peptide-methionine (S)-S-oxide reductase MsrA [Flavobacteriaceae bacterium]|jgi:peptide-methionine (S)-S-oxide reductase|nr:peptide-methionine (S)-S-oxide reductase MsrA [Flavobacteriaceae bacterium]
MKLFTYSFLLALLFSCQNNAQKSINSQPGKSKIQQDLMKVKPVTVPLVNGKARAYFASGCFWCVEAVYESLIGVEEVINGYSGGHTLNPTYEASNTGRTGHAEAVEVIYNPSIIDFATLVDVYFGSQNPIQVNGQGPDIGSQYRSIIFYQNDKQKQTIISKKETLSKQLKKRLAAEIMPFQKFWMGEDYHQNYERLHPESSYIQRISIPRLNKFKRKFPQLLKDTH